MAFSAQQEQFEQVEQYTEFLSTYYREEIGDLVQHYPSEQQSLSIEWSDLYQFSPELAEEYRNDPEKQGELLDEALGEVDLPIDMDLSGARVRVHAPENESLTLSVGETRAKHCGEFLALYGQISKTSKVQPKLLKAAFECQRCGSLTQIPTTGNEVQPPQECQGCERQGPFRLNQGQSEFVDHQLLRLQQPPEEVQGGQGRHIDVHVEGEDIVADLAAGDRVDLSGTLDIGEFEEGKPTVETFFSGEAARVEETDYEDIDIHEHRDRIESLAAGDEGDPYDLLTASFAPKIRGHGLIKQAIVLQLFGGCQVEHTTGERDRGDSHIMLLGDPGTGKSDMLKAATAIAPRSAYASGKGASAAGLTAAAVADDFGDAQWSLKAGAMVKANKGVAALDELDKIKEEAVSSLHGALEAQKVNVDKAGINTTLPAETAALAAGNPKYGRFDQYESMAEQVNIPPALLSRFDLMFLVKDEPDEERDKELASHVISYRQGGIGDGDDEAIDIPVEEDLFRAWIAHAKRSVQPEIEDDDVAEELAESFAEFRQLGGDDSPVPVTLRKLEGLLRLAEASARVRLSETVEMQDIDRARELVGESLRQVGMDPETGEFDVDMVETGSSKAQHDRIRTVLKVIDDAEDEGTRGAPKDTIRERATAKGIDESKLDHTIQKLKNKGEIVEPNADELRTVLD